MRYMRDTVVLEVVVFSISIFAISTIGARILMYMGIIAYQ